jgi:hypothetical protein
MGRLSGKGPAWVTPTRLSGLKPTGRFFARKPSIERRRVLVVRLFARLVVCRVRQEPRRRRAYGELGVSNLNAQSREAILRLGLYRLRTRQHGVFVSANRELKR